VLQCVAVCCSVLQCVAVCCSVLQCVAVCCNVLQCVAVCCSGSQPYTMVYIPWYTHVGSQHDGMPRSNASNRAAMPGSTMACLAAIIVLQCLAARCNASYSAMLSHSAMVSCGTPRNGILPCISISTHIHTYKQIYYMYVWIGKCRYVDIWICISCAYIHIHTYLYESIRTRQEDLQEWPAAVRNSIYTRTRTYVHIWYAYMNLRMYVQRDIGIWMYVERDIRISIHVWGGYR